MASRRWSAGEMAALIDAWRPLYDRRRGGESDMWVPPSQRTRARSTGTLATEDWRAVATAVNSFRAEINLVPNRTHKQCKRRVELLKSQFGDKKLATPSWYGFLPVVCDNTTAGGRGHSRLGVLASAAMDAHGGDECGGGAAGRQARGGSAVAQGGSAAAEVDGGVVTGAGAAMKNASDGVAVAVEEGGTVTPPPSRPDPVTAAVTGFFGGPIPKKRRTGASTSTSTGAGDGRAPSVKEELVREANARRARVDEGRAPAGGFAATAPEMAGGHARVEEGSAPAGGFAAAAPEMAAALGGRARVEEGRAPAGGFAATAPEMAAALGELLAAESNDVAVVANLSETFKEAMTMYREVTMQRIELQRQMLAALSVTTGGAAVPEPDAARP